MQPNENWAKGHDSFLTPLQQRAYEGYQRLVTEANRRGWKPASLISLHPFHWPVTGPIHQTDIKVPAVPLTEELWNKSPKLKLSNGLEVPFAHYVFTMWRPCQRKYLLGQMDFEEQNESSHIWPLEQAEDAVKQNGLGADRGGVFCYEGAHPPLSAKETFEQERALFEQAHATQMVYYETMYTRYSDAYMTIRTTNSWRDLVGKGKYHRWIALYLYRVGRLKALPSWYEEIAAPGTKMNEKCGWCKRNVEPDSVGCPHCDYILRPFEAFAKFSIDAGTPGARAAAKRCSQNELRVLVESGVLSIEQLIEWNIEAPGKPKAK
jgi:hypothetical protein